MAVASRVIRVEVAVRDELDVGDAMAGRAKSFLDRPHVHGLVEIDHLSRLRREARVEKENAPRMLDNEGGDHDALARKAIAVGGHGVVPGMDGLDARVDHVRLTLAA